MRDDIKFCQRCGSELGEKLIEDRTRPFCFSCGFVVYLDPKVAAVVVLSMDDKLVFIRRGVEPSLGEWAFPSGYVDRAEVVEDAARREVVEETGLVAELDRLIGIYSLQGNPVILAVFAGHVVGGTMAAGHDATDVRLFSLDDLPPMPFPHDEQILHDWQSSR